MEKRGVESNDRTGHASSSTASRMLLALTAAASGDGTSADEVDAAARALVTELRLANEPPEQVLVQIKQILADAGLKPSHGSVDATHIVGRHVALYRSVIESSIRHYFAVDDGPERANA